MGWFKRDAGQSRLGPGVHNPAMIDLVTQDKDGRVILYMVASGEWFELGQPLQALQEKINNYLAYALDGQMAAQYPEFADHPVVIVLRYPNPPDAALAGFVASAARVLFAHTVGFELEVAPDLRGK